MIIIKACPYLAALSGISEVDRLSPPVNGASPCDSAHLEKKKAVVPDQPNTPNIEVQVSARMYGAPLVSGEEKTKSKLCVNL